MKIPDKVKIEDGWVIIITDYSSDKGKIFEFYGHANTTPEDKFGHMKYSFSWKHGKMHYSYPDLVPANVKKAIRELCLATLKAAGQETKKSYKKFSAGRK